MHLTLGILRKSQAVSHTLAFFWLDGFAVPAPAQVTQTVGRLAKNNKEKGMSLRINFYLLTHYLFPIIFSLFLVGCIFTGSYQSPFLIGVSINSEGQINVGLSPSLITPIGTFTLSSETTVMSLRDISDKRLLIIRVDKQATVYTLEKGKEFKIEFKDEDKLYSQVNLVYETDGDIVLELESVERTNATLQPTPRANTKVSVPGNEIWVSTGVEVSAGQILTILASGNINTLPDETGASLSDPNGQEWSCPYTNDSTVANVDCLLNGEPYGALIAKIGNGRPFKVGSSFTVHVSENGVLYLSVNDNLPYYDDNTGNYTVVITLH